MINRIVWCALLVGCPHLIFTQPVAAIIGVILAALLWGVTAADRDHWQLIARMRRHDTPDDLTDTAPWVAHDERHVR